MFDGWTVSASNRRGREPHHLPEGDFGPAARVVSTSGKPRHSRATPATQKHGATRSRFSRPSRRSRDRSTGSLASRATVGYIRWEAACAAPVCRQFADDTASGGTFANNLRGLARIALRLRLGLVSLSYTGPKRPSRTLGPQAGSRSQSNTRRLPRGPVRPIFGGRALNSAAPVPNHRPAPSVPARRTAELLRHRTACHQTC